jgi:large subunit ribosomal protein L29
MKITELRQKSKSELQKLLQDSRERLRQLRFDLASGKVKNVREIRELKKDIARILTLLKEEPISEMGRKNPSVLPSKKTGSKATVRNRGFLRSEPKASDLTM